MSLYFLRSFLLNPYQEPCVVGSASSSDPIYTEVEQSSKESYLHHQYHKQRLRRQKKEKANTKHKYLMDIFIIFFGLE